MTHTFVQYNRKLTGLLLVCTSTLPLFSLSSLPFPHHTLPVTHLALGPGNVLNDTVRLRPSPNGSTTPRPSSTSAREFDVRMSNAPSYAAPSCTDAGPFDVRALREIDGARGGGDG